MEQMISHQNGRSLLGYAIARLSPEIFSHPVWIRFGQKEVSEFPTLIPDLVGTARDLEQTDPSGACQILLICAVYQNYAGQAHNAIITTQQALALARRTNLGRETAWAIWGACAISVQQGNVEQAAALFVELQAVLSEQNEWILAAYVDVLRQTLFQPGRRNTENHAGTAYDDVFEDMITPTLDWFQHWGFTTQLGSDFELAAEHSVNTFTRQDPVPEPFFSSRRRPGRWHTLMLAIQGELRLRWTRNSSPPGKSKLSFWGTILSSLHLFIYKKTVDTESPEEPSQTPPLALLPTVKENLAFQAPKSSKKTGVKRVKSRKNQRSSPAVKIVPVTVQMLGVFGMTVGDLTVKLPSSRSTSLLKYLLFHHKQKIPREVLMDTFWPDAEPETARNSLNVAMHGLRQNVRKLTGMTLIVFESGSYGLAPALQVWVDVDEFERAHKTGYRLETRNQLIAAIAEYECAISLYQGDFLEENLYEEWTVLDRERFRAAYLETLDRLSQIYFRQERYSACRSACQLILASDPCREDAHCLLMRCYSRQGQHHLALYQYQRCVEALRAELDVVPALETTQLHDAIRRREHV